MALRGISDPRAGMADKINGWSARCRKPGWVYGFKKSATTRLGLVRVMTQISDLCASPMP